jgi:hypothetical protein
MIVFYLLEAFTEHLFSP